jgi:glycosidase
MTGGEKREAGGRRSVFLFACVAIIVSACVSAKPTPLVIGPRTDPNVWWRNGVCYEVFVRSFYDSDGDGIGDLKGLTARLDYINDGKPNSSASLGANCIWLMPIDRATSYHGYDVIDYYHVDPQYGTDEDFRELVRQAHQRGIRVIVDFVPNHASSEHPAFQTALNDPSSSARTWFRFTQTKPAQRGPWGQEAWHKSPVRDEYYWAVFWHGMPDWNYASPSVLDEMLKVTSYWLTTMHADGFRFDAIPYLVEDGDTLMHSRGTHDVLRRFGEAIRRQSPQSFTVGEESDMSALPMYYPDQLDSYFEFGVAAAILEAARTGNAAPFVSEIRAATATLPEGRWAPFLTNHDQPRVMNVLGDISRARIAASALLLLPGTPFVYYGEEIGMVGAKPDEMIRTPMQWSGAANAGFTAGKAWEALQPDWRTTNVAAQAGKAGSLLTHYRRLIQLRNAHVALSRGQLLLGSTNTAAVAAFVRQSGDETILVALNFGEAAAHNVGARIAQGTRGSRQWSLVHSDPIGSCGGASVSSEGRSITFASIEAHGLCVFELR